LVLREEQRMTSDRTFVIVGAGLAGATAAETLRSEGFTGRVVLLGSEAQRPYNRPPLSKGYLRGEAKPEEVWVHEEGYYGAHDIELRLGRTAAGLDAAARVLELDDGDRLRYDRLLLATGSEPRRLDVPGADLEGVHYLRTIEDADVLRERLGQGGRLVVIGAGWIGIEVAASARQAGMDVTVIAPAKLPLVRILGDEIGTFYRDLHVEHGVTFRLGEKVAALEGSGRVERVRTGSGDAIDCDLVVVGIGVTPRTQLAERAGIAVDNGVLVDEHLQTTVAGIYAAGDIANAEHPFYRERIRVEHWANALNQGPVAAQAMLGQPATFDKLPFFYSDQYDAGMEYSGFARTWDKVVFRGDLAGREFIAFWLQDGRVVAGMNMNIWDVNEQLQRLISSRAVIAEARLTDPDVPLEELAGTTA
jgi:3-phenylpropionate/trans-cinnamate dioxygenase ferredoxin reductase subunit